MTYRSHYPIGKAVIDLLNRSGLTLDEFVRQLGYRKESKGKAEFFFLINHGLCDLKFRDALKKLISDTISLELAWQHTAEIRRAEDEEELTCLERYERKSFKPHLFPLYNFSLIFEPRTSKSPDKRHSQVVEFPEEFAAASDEQRLVLVKNAIQEHYRENSGRKLHSERLSAYVLFSEYEGDGRYFNTNGDPADSADCEGESDQPILSLDEVTLARIDRGDFDEN